MAKKKTINLEKKVFYSFNDLCRNCEDAFNIDAFPATIDRELYWDYIMVIRDSYDFNTFHAHYHGCKNGVVIVDLEFKCTFKRYESKFEVKRIIDNRPNSTEIQQP